MSHEILGKIQKIPVKLLSQGLTLTDLMAHPGSPCIVVKFEMESAMLKPIMPLEHMPKL